MTLLLVNAPMLHVARIDRAACSSHLHLIYSYLRARGVPVEVFDATVELGVPGSDLSAYSERLARELSRRKFRVAGVSCWTSYQYLGSCVVGEILRRQHPTRPLVVGGYHPTLLPADFLGAESPFDWIVQGPGEQVLFDLYRQAQRPATPGILVGKPAPLDDVAFDTSYPYAHGALFLSRGCPHACLYCSDRAAAPSGCSVEHALEEVQRAADCSTDGMVHVLDACFGMDVRWRRSFLTRLAEMGFQHRLDVELRVDQLGDEDIDLLAKVGARVYLGVESGCADMLRIMRKTSRPERFLERFRQVLGRCDDRGVDYLIGLLYNHPGETRDTLQKSIDFVSELAFRGPSARLDALVVHRYAYLPGSPFDAVREEFAVRYGTSIGYPSWWKIPTSDYRAMSEANTASRDLSLEEAISMAQRFDVAGWFARRRRRMATPRDLKNPSLGPHASAAP